MNYNLEQEEINLQDLAIEKQNAGIRRDFTQIGNTITFELKRNFKKFIVMLIVYFAMFLLLLLIPFLLEIFIGVEFENSLEYLQQLFSSQYGILGLLTIISAAIFGGSIISEDFSAQTGNLLFPKISKTRLLIGRIIARFSYIALCTGFLYTLMVIVTFIRFGDVPITILLSLLWALYYAFAVFSFVILMSSLMKNTSMSIIFSILIFLMVFQMIWGIFMFSGFTDEFELPMFFILSYYEGIISGSLEMPATRYGPIPGQMFGGSEPFNMWITPNAIGAGIGLLIYISILLSIAYIRYIKRQSKGE